ncbi:Uncharacterised protein [Cytobacillus firmus]|nr:Uncharacterised protein [Cytobacillus firmus]
MFSFQVVFGFVLFFIAVYVVIKLDKMSSPKNKHNSKQRSK